MASKPDQKGIVGLKDSGKNSFINAIIQCLAQTPTLTELFLNNAHQDDVNANNPLGYGGRIAQSYVMLLQQIWSQ